MVISFPVAENNIENIPDGDNSFLVTVTVTITFPHCLLLSVWKLCHWPSSILLSDHLDDHYDHNDHHYLDDLDDYDDPNNHKIIIL